MSIGVQAGALRVQSGFRQLAAGLVCAVAAACSSTPEAPPDILLVTVDTLRADHLGTYGFEYPTSPRIDALAAESVVFERAIAAAGRTAPSHASIMTSRYTREHSIGYRNGPTKLVDTLALAGIFHDAGYATAAFVSNLLLTAFTGLDRGFDVYDADLRNPGQNRSRVAERIAEETAARAIEWIDQSDERPLFIWVHLQDPHGPYSPPDAFRGRFEFERPAEEPLLPVLGEEFREGGIPAYQYIEPLRRMSEYRGLYSEEILYADHWIGRLLDHFDAKRSERPRIVFLTSDHGESFGESPYYLSHMHSTTPDVAWVPMILRAPGLAPERRHEVVSHVDVMPTLLELAGLTVPEGLSGVALGPLLRGEGEWPDRWVYCDNGESLSAYRGDAFVRVEGAMMAYRTSPRIKKIDRLLFGWALLDWPRTGGWANPFTHPAPSRKRSAKGLPAPIREYMASPAPMTVRPPLSAEVIEQLRALGYAED